METKKCIYEFRQRVKQVKEKHTVYKNLFKKLRFMT